MVRPDGIEPPTSALGVPCSIQLSYGRPLRDLLTPGRVPALAAAKSGTVPTDYDLLERQVRGLLEDERDPIANAANFAAFVFAELPSINWAGFYFPATDGLVLGPFGGKPACTRLPKGQGICNRAFDEKRTVVVDDVSTAADHIYCDSASRSELVVPLIVGGVARGVFDLDSPELARFTPADQAGIERLVAAFLDSTPM